MKLRVKLMLWVGIPFCIIFFAVSVFSYWNASTLLKESTKREMMALAELDAEKVSESLKAQRNAIDGLTEAWVAEVPTNEAFIPIGQELHGARRCQHAFHRLP